MSKQTIAENTGNQMTINTDLSRIFVGDNRYEKASYNNGTYDDVTILAGTVLGRIAVSGRVVPFNSAGADGSQFIVGIAGPEAQTIAEGTTKEIYFCVAGDVVADQLIFQGGDTLDTVVSGRRVRDKIGAETVGVKLITQNSDLTRLDNQP